MTFLYLTPLLLLFAACGNDGDGNNDTIFTGLSGVVILIIVIWLISRWARNRG